MWAILKGRRRKYSTGIAAAGKLDFCVLMNSSVAHKNVFASAQKYAAIFGHHDLALELNCQRRERESERDRQSESVVAGRRRRGLCAWPKVQTALQQLETMHLIDFKRFKQTNSEKQTNQERARWLKLREMRVLSAECSSRFKKQTY